MFHLLFSLFLAFAPAAVAGERGEEFAAVATELGLSDTQKTQVMDLVYKANLARADIQARRAKAEMELKHLMMAQTLDEKSIDRALASLNTAEADLRSNRVELMVEIRKVLSYEQWVALAEIWREKGE